MARFFLCLAAAACCLAVLVPPVQGRLGIGLDGGFGATNRRTAEQQQQQHQDTTAKAAPSVWSTPWTAAGRVRPELRSVPGGPDPLHHHGTPWQPELEPTVP